MKKCGDESDRGLHEEIDEMAGLNRREFMLKGGKYALVTATAMQVLFTAPRARAQSGMAIFKVWVDPNDFNYGSMVGEYSPTVARSPAATWRVETSYARYQKYHIEFEGNTAHLPDPVTVTITTDPGNFVNYSNNDFRWTCQNSVPIPKSGGTIGRGGDFCTGNSYPITGADFPPGQDITLTGTVTFSAPGVETLVLTVQHHRA